MKTGPTLIDGFILAGGTSRRMGKNKASLRLAGRTFLECTADALGAVSGTVRIIGDLKSECSDLEVLPDVVGDITEHGAIIGLLSALHYSSREWTAVLACDLPFVTPELMVRLAEMAAEEPKAACALPLQKDGRIQPLCGLYRKLEVLAAVEENYRTGKWRLQNVIGSLSARLIPFENLEDLAGSANFFFNVNTSDEYEQAIAIVNASTI